MADPINLRLARKAKRRADADERAAANRVRFGEAKDAKALRKAEAERQTRHLDGTRRDT